MNRRRVECPPLARRRKAKILGELLLQRPIEEGFAASVTGRQPRRPRLHEAFPAGRPGYAPPAGVPARQAAKARKFFLSWNRFRLKKSLHEVKKSIFLLRRRMKGRGSRWACMGTVYKPGASGGLGRNPAIGLLLCHINWAVFFAIPGAGPQGFCADRTHELAALWGPVFALEELVFFNAAEVAVHQRG